MATQIITFRQAQARPAAPVLQRLWAQVQHALAARRVEHQLAAMEPRLLADIGLPPVEPGRAAFEAAGLLR